jgi:glycosyltransferase involved in cell wall biosynthesis
MDAQHFQICIVGPMPPPFGGMANQCEQLVRLLRGEGVQVELVRTNAPYRPGWIAHLPYVRALFRLIPFLARLWKAAGRAQVMHVLANSGWAWHLCASPALSIAHLRGTPVIVNYRGGNAAKFFGSARRHVLKALSRADLRVAPSAFLSRVFLNHGLEAEVIPNIVDLTRFPFRPLRAFGEAPHIVVTRNLEPIYDIPTALAAFARIREVFPKAVMTVAGSGPELEGLRASARRLGIEGSVRFAGHIDNADIAKLYATADCLVNPSTIDNMPISILEAFASGVPVVSTDAGGIPDILHHGRSGLLVPVGDDVRMAVEVLNVLKTRSLAESLVRAGRAEAERYEWQRVRDQWLDAYVRTLRSRRTS